MKKQYLYYLLLTTAVIVDAWLISHPNLLGKFGIWFYKYSYFSNFTKSLITVSITALISSILAAIIKRFTKASTSRIILGILTILSLAMAVQLFIQFSSGTYKLTGTSFKTGICLLPVILVFIFLKNFLEIQTKTVQKPVIQSDKSSI
jgi:hypothetical protein